MSESENSSSNGSFLQRMIPVGFYNLVREEQTFLTIMAVFFITAGVTFPHAAIAKWVGFALAGYSAIANDSIQTIGTFIASNEDKKWWTLWLFIGGIFLATVSYSWYAHGGDVSYGRLASKGFAQAPQSFTFLQIAAPIFLLLLTRMRMPVSTTFLILSCFAADADAIKNVMIKSLSGYLVAFVAAIAVWILLSRIIKKLVKGEPHPAWTIFQWITSGCLWAVWIMQDAANIAVYLPRSLSFWQFAAFAGYIFLGLGILFYLRGDKIQRVVTEKSNVRDIRSAAIINFVYAIILYYFKMKSQIPMSTTWVFIGLLAGREIAMTFTDARGKGKPLKKSLKLIGKDVGYSLIGLAVSIALAISINPEIKAGIVKYFFG